MTTHEKIKRLRQQKGLSQDSLAAAIHKSRAVVSHWERGITPVTVDDCQLLAVFFNIPIEDLVSSNALPENSQDEFLKGVESFFMDKTKTREELDQLFKSVFDIYAKATKSK